MNGVKGQFGWFASDMHGFCNTFKARSGGSPNVLGRKLMQARPSISPTLHLTDHTPGPPLLFRSHNVPDTQQM